MFQLCALHFFGRPFEKRFALWQVGLGPGTGTLC